MSMLPEVLTERYKAGIRLMVLGMRTCDAAEVHGIRPYDLSRAYRSEAGQAYADHIRGLCEHYAAAMHVLGLLPQDITRPGTRTRKLNPPSNPAALRKVAATSIKKRLGPTKTDDTGE